MPEGESREETRTRLLETLYLFPAHTDTARLAQKVAATAIEYLVNEWLYPADPTDVEAMRADLRALLASADGADRIS